MAVVMRLGLGDAIYCADGVWGEVTDVVIDPTTRRVTHLGEAPVEDPDWEVGVSDLLALPYYGSLDSGGLGMPIEPLGFDGHVTEIYDRVPKNKVEIRRASSVFSGDEHLVGHVDGFVVGSDELISHIVLEHGHLWGKRDVTIPISAVAEIGNDEVKLTLSKDEVGELTSVSVRRWGGPPG